MGEVIGHMSVSLAIKENSVVAKEEMGLTKTNYFKVGEGTACLDTEGNNPVTRENVILQERDAGAKSWNR